MLVPTRQVRTARNAFTLVELLLAVTLLAGLIGAVAFGFSNLQRNAQLDEGVERIETALRFARAHAASTGHKVQVVLAPTPPAAGLLAGSASSPASTASTDSTSPAGGTADPVAGSTPLRIEWEPDPVRAPGVFEPLATLSTDVTDVSDLVEVRAIEREVPGTLASASDVSAGSGGRGNAASPSATSGPNASTLASIPMVDESADTGNAASDAADPMKPAAITFYPDGSCDGATIVLASRDMEDSREVAVRLQGVTGTTRREWREPAGAGAAAADLSAPSARSSTATPTPSPASRPASSASGRRP